VGVETAERQLVLSAWMVRRWTLPNYASNLSISSVKPVISQRIREIGM